MVDIGYSLELWVSSS